MDATAQVQIDAVLIALWHGAQGRSKANAILGASLVAKAAVESGLPCTRILAVHGMSCPYDDPPHDGAHVDNNVDIQEFMICPCGPVVFAEALRTRRGNFPSPTQVLHEHGYATNVGMKRFAPPAFNEEALDGLRGIERWLSSG